MERRRALNVHVQAGISQHCIQAGDVVKGGRQDRTIGVGFVLPAKSGRVPIPSFCVEIGRWHRRAAESDRQEAPPRVRVDTRRGEKAIVFETCDHGFNDAVLHMNLVAH